MLNMSEKECSAKVLVESFMKWILYHAMKIIELDAPSNYCTVLDAVLLHCVSQLSLIAFDRLR